eukprot:scaffold16638_cov120-Isochrysis_galbana.AAC.6
MYTRVEQAAQEGVAEVRRVIALRIEPKESQLRRGVGARTCAVHQDIWDEPARRLHVFLALPGTGLEPFRVLVLAAHSRVARRRPAVVLRLPRIERVDVVGGAASAKHSQHRGAAHQRVVYSPELTSVAVDEHQHDGSLDAIARQVFRVDVPFESLAQHHLLRPSGPAPPAAAGLSRVGVQEEERAVLRLERRGAPAGRPVVNQALAGFGELKPLPSLNRRPRVDADASRCVLRVAWAGPAEQPADAVVDAVSDEPRPAL